MKRHFLLLVLPLSWTGSAALAMRPAPRDYIECDALDARLCFGLAAADLVRRDYERAEQLGSREALDAFLAAHPNAAIYTFLATQLRNIILDSVTPEKRQRQNIRG